VASCIDFRVAGDVYISGTSFVGYTDRAIRINSQENVTLAVSTFVVESSYFWPGPGGEGKAIDVQLGRFSPDPVHFIRSSVFNSAVPEVRVKVQGGASLDLVVESSVLFLGDPGSLVVFTAGQSADPTRIAPTQVSTASVPGQVVECPSQPFGPPPAAPAVPSPTPPGSEAFTSDFKLYAAHRLWAILGPFLLGWW
jgi:hypothetical protein